MKMYLRYSTIAIVVIILSIISISVYADGMDGTIIEELEPLGKTVTVTARSEDADTDSMIRELLMIGSFEIEKLDYYSGITSSDHGGIRTQDSNSYIRGSWGHLTSYGYEPIKWDSAKPGRNKYIAFTPDPDSDYPRQCYLELEYNTGVDAVSGIRNSGMTRHPDNANFDGDVLDLRYVQIAQPTASISGCFDSNPITYYVPNRWIKLSERFHSTSIRDGSKSYFDLLIADLPYNRFYRHVVKTGDGAYGYSETYSSRSQVPGFGALTIEPDKIKIPVTKKDNPSYTRYLLQYKGQHDKSWKTSALWYGFGDGLSRTNSVTELTPNKLYLFRAKTRNETDSEGRQTETKYRVLGVYTKAAKFGLEVTPDNTDCKCLKLEVKNASNNPTYTEYKIERATNREFKNDLKTVQGWTQYSNKSKISDTGLDPGTEYFYRIKARNNTLYENTVRSHIGDMNDYSEIEYYKGGTETDYNYASATTYKEAQYRTAITKNTGRPGGSSTEWSSWATMPSTPKITRTITAEGTNYVHIETRYRGFTDRTGDFAPTPAYGENEWSRNNIGFTWNGTNGNYQSNETSAHRYYGPYKIDRTAPVITLTPNSSDGKYSDVHSVKITVTDTLSGVDTSSTYYIWTQSDKFSTEPLIEWTEFTPGNTVKSPDAKTAATGRWYLHVQAKDIAGNESKKTSGAFYLAKRPEYISSDIKKMIANSHVYAQNTNTYWVTGDLSRNHFATELVVKNEGSNLEEIGVRFGNNSFVCKPDGEIRQAETADPNTYLKFVEGSAKEYNTNLYRQEATTCVSEKSKSHYNGYPLYVYAKNKYKLYFEGSDSNDGWLKSDKIVKIDNDAPFMEFDHKPEYWYNGGYILTMTPKDGKYENRMGWDLWCDGSGVKEWSWNHKYPPPEEDESTENTTADSASIYINKEGKHEISVEVTDNVLNKHEETQTFYLDTKPPEISYYEDNPCCIVPGDKVRICFDDSNGLPADQVSGTVRVDYRWRSEKGNTRWMRGVEPEPDMNCAAKHHIDIELPQDRYTDEIKEWKLYIEAYDKAGNKNEEMFLVNAVDLRLDNIKVTDSGTVGGTGSLKDVTLPAIVESNNNVHYRIGLIGIKLDKINTKIWDPIGETYENITATYIDKENDVNWYQADKPKYIPANRPPGTKYGIMVIATLPGPCNRDIEFPVQDADQYNLYGDHYPFVRIKGNTWDRVRFRFVN